MQVEGGAEGVRLKTIQGAGLTHGWAPVGVAVVEEEEGEEPQVGIESLIKKNKRQIHSAGISKSCLK